MKKILSMAIPIVVLSMAIACSSSSNGDTVPANGVVGKVTDTKGAVVAGVSVTSGATGAVTDSKGRYVLDISLQDGANPVVTFAKNGYVTIYRKVKLVQKNASRLDVTIAKVGGQVELSDPAAGGQLAGAGLTLKLDPNVLVDSAGNPVQGAVKFDLTHLDPANKTDLQAYPGTLVGKDADGKVSALKTYGVVDVTARQGDKKLQIAAGKTLTVEVPAPTGVENPPAEVALWSMDDKTGIWVQEGTATYDANKKVYVAKLPHLSPWNLDQPDETTCIKGMVVDQSGSAVGGGQVTFYGLQASMTGDTTTDDSGHFCMSAPINQKITVVAIHPAGGATEKGVTTWGKTIPYPPKCDECQDIGLIKVKSGIFEDVHGNTESCDKILHNMPADCMAAFQEYSECFKPSGNCVVTSKDYTTTTTTWDNGAHIEVNSSFNGGDNTKMISRNYGADGTLCATTVIQKDGEIYDAATTLKDGKSWDAKIDPNTQEMDMICSDGSKVHWTKSDMEAYSACTGQDYQKKCKYENGGPGNGNNYNVCTTDSDCDTGYECCKEASEPNGVCIPKGACPY